MREFKPGEVKTGEVEAGGPRGWRWVWATFGTLITAVGVLVVVACVFSALAGGREVKSPLSISAFWTNLPFLIYHVARYVGARRGGDLPRRAQYAQLVKGNILMAWWAWVYTSTEARPNPGTAGSVQSLLFLASLWYLCSAAGVRRRVEKKLALAQAQPQAEPEAGVWPPPPARP